MQNLAIFKRTPADVHVHASTTSYELSVDPGTLLHQIYSLSERLRATAEREVLRAHQLDMRDWLVLRALANLERSTQRVIAAATDLDKVAVNRAASWLKERGFIASLPNADDGRSHILELLPAGIEIFDACSREIAKLETDLLFGLAEGDDLQLSKLLKHLQRSLTHRF